MDFEFALRPRGPAMEAFFLTQARALAAYIDRRVLEHLLAQAGRSAAHTAALHPQPQSSR